MANIPTTSNTPSPKPSDIFVSGGGSHSELIPSASLETATPLPQRWGLLREGRAVFRREDRVYRLRAPRRRLQSQFSGGGAACSKRFIPCLPGPRCVTV